MLRLQGLESGIVEGKGILKEGLKFGDICFADDSLVYSIAGRGVYYIPFDQMYDRIGQEYLLSDTRCLYKCVNPVELAWVKAKHILMIIEKSTESLETVNYILFDEEKKAKEIDIEWIFDNKNHVVRGNAVECFCASNDGKYIALSGDKLAVLKLVENEYYQLVRAPIEAKISCSCAEFMGCTGLAENRLEFLKERGAIIEKQENK